MHNQILLMQESISGVILAGGSNERFPGIIKANIIVGKKPIISGIISTIEGFFDEIIIVSNKPEEFRKYFQCKIVRDHFQKVGPLGGIHAALKSSSKDAIFVFAGDMPFLNKKIIAYQIEEFSKRNYSVLIPEIDQSIEPLHAIYSKSILTDLERFIIGQKSRAVRDFLGEINVGYLHLSNTKQTKKAFTNINSPADLKEVIK